MKKITNPISLADLAKETGVNKSKLAYYTQEKLIKPIAKISTTNIFERLETIATIAEISRLQKLGKKIKEIRKLLN